MTGPTLQPKKMPTKLRSDLFFYQHQLDGVRWLAGRKSWILADQPGLGKTIQSLSAAAIEWDQRGPLRILVVCDASLKRNWAKEILKLTEYRHHILEGINYTQREASFNAYLAANDDILIVHYDQLVSRKLKQPDGSFVRTKVVEGLLDMEWDIVIADEAHALKNPTASRTKALHNLRVRRWFLVTGTPMENRPDELWSLLKLAIPETQGYWKWVQRFCLYGGHGGHQIVGVKRKDELKTYLEDVMLRRLKRDCLDLPDKHYVKVETELSDVQKDLYRSIIDELVIKLPGSPTPMEVETGLKRSLRLRQICSTPANIEGLPDDSGKLDAVVAQTKDVLSGGNKLVTFTEFRGTLHCLERRYESLGIPVFTVFGTGMALDERDRRQERWAKSKEPGVFLATRQSSGRGLTLTEANYMALVERPFNPSKREQEEDRIHRIGASSTEPVTIMDFICQGTYEDEVEKILERKGALQDELIPNSGWQERIYKAILATAGSF